MGTASGELYWDDGESLMDPIESSDAYYHFNFHIEVDTNQTRLTIECDKSPKVAGSRVAFVMEQPISILALQDPLMLPTVDTIEILGYKHRPNLDSATLN